MYHDVANAIYDVMPWGPSDPGLFGVPITHRRFYCVSEAAATFGLASPTVVKYVEATGIARIFVSNCGRRRFLIDAEAAHRTFDTSGYVRVDGFRSLEDDLTTRDRIRWPDTTYQSDGHKRPNGSVFETRRTA